MAKLGGNPGLSKLICADVSPEQSHKLQSFALGETEKFVPFSSAALKQKRKDLRGRTPGGPALDNTLTHKQYLGFLWASLSLQSPREKEFSVLKLRALPQS